MRLYEKRVYDMYPRGIFAESVIGQIVIFATYFKEIQKLPTLIGVFS
jgi:hypothetical protein